MNIIKKTFLITAILALPVFVLAQTSNSDRVAMTEKEQAESIEAVSKSIETLQKETDKIESDIESGVKKTIDEVIIDTRDQVDIESYELRNTIFDVEERVTTSVRSVIKSSDITDSSVADTLEVEIDSAIKEIESRIETRSGVEIDTTDNLNDIKNTLALYRQKIEENKAIIEGRGGDLINKDSDGDGLSDYDEVYIYNTDPESAVTVSTGGRGSGLNDSQKIEAGINPASEEGEDITPADPRTDQTAFVTDLYTVNRIDLVDADSANAGDNDEVPEKNLYLQGTALPNSYITVYVFSTPIIVTVKTDNRGEWEYTFDQKLDDGNHEVYVATVNNSGKLVARSNSIPFTKTAEAAAFGSFQVDDNSEVQTFVEKNLELLVLTILLAAILITLMLTGRRSKTSKLIAAANEKTIAENADGVTSVEVEGEDSERV